jgi:hypothetical protein
MMILKMVIMLIIRVKSINLYMSILCVLWLLLHLCIMRIMAIIAIIAYSCVVRWLESLGSRVVYVAIRGYYYELEYKNLSCMSFHSKYTGQTSSCTCRRHWHYHDSAPHAQRIFERSRRPQAGRRRWMPDVVRQLVGIGMVP